MGHHPHAKDVRVTAQLEIAIAAFVLAIGTAGVPVEPVRMVIAAILCLAVWRSGRFVGSVAMLAVIACAYLQHDRFRITSLVAAALLGIVAHFVYRRKHAPAAVMAVSVLLGLSFLFVR